MSSRLLRTAVAVAAFPAIAAVAPAAAHACTFAIVNGSAIAPAQALEQTADGVPLQVSYAGPATNRTVQFGIARLDTATLPPLGTVLPAEVGTVVETGELTYDAATNTWNGVANGSGWAQTPGEYV